MVAVVRSLARSDSREATTISIARKARPIAVEVSNCSLTDTISTSCCLIRSRKLKKSLGERLPRSSEFTTTAATLGSNLTRSFSACHAGR